PIRHQQRRRQRRRQRILQRKLRPQHAEEPVNPEINAILSRIARRYDEAGGGSNARVQASHEFDQAFSIDVLNAMVTKPLPDQEPLFGKMLAHFDAWLKARRDGVRKPAGLRLFGKPGRGKTALAFLLAKLGAAYAGLTPS